MHTSNVDYEVDSAPYQGYLAYDDTSSGYRPGIMICPAFRGRDKFAEQKARELAEMGYVGFVFDPYGEARYTEDVQQARDWMYPLRDDRTELRRRLTGAFSVLTGLEVVETPKLAVMGYCFGGLCALELARTGADLRAAISFHGILATPTPQDAENIRCRVLALHGNEDTIVSPAEVMAFYQEMTAAGVDWQLHNYGHAPHGFTKDPKSIHARRSWETLQRFLVESLR